MVHPTEDYELVKNSLENLLSPIQLEETKKGSLQIITVEFHDREMLRIIRQMIHDRRIIDAVRSRLRSNWNGSDSSFVRFDKQTATLRKLRLIDDRDERPPLGSILLECAVADETEFSSFLDWFVPPTENGRIVQF